MKEKMEAGQFSINQYLEAVGHLTGLQLLYAYTCIKHETFAGEYESFRGLTFWELTF